MLAEKEHARPVVAHGYASSLSKQLWIGKPCAFVSALTRCASLQSPRDLLTFPRYFTCSLEKRIAPRTLFILQNGLDPAPIALQKVMALTDQSFAERTAGRPHDDFLLFLDTWEQLPAWQEWQQAAQSAAILAAAAAATAAQRLDDDGTDDRVHSSNKDAR